MGVFWAGVSMLAFFHSFRGGTSFCWSPSHAAEMNITLRLWYRTTKMEPSKAPIHHLWKNYEQTGALQDPAIKQPHTGKWPDSKATLKSFSNWPFLLSQFTQAITVHRQGKRRTYIWMLLMLSCVRRCRATHTHSTH